MPEYQTNKGNLSIGLRLGKYSTQLGFDRRKFDALSFGILLQRFSVTQARANRASAGESPNSDINCRVLAIRRRPSGKIRQTIVRGTFEPLPPLS
jgi:hypothetical protein